MIAHILNNWIGDGIRPETAHRPAVVDLIRGLGKPGLSVTDVTGQVGGPGLPNPAVLVVACVLDAATLALVKADPAHGPDAVLHTDADADTPHDAASFGKLRAKLATLGANPAQVSAAVGAAPGGRTRRQVAQALIAWAKTLPKAP